MTSSQQIAHVRPPRVGPIGTPGRRFALPAVAVSSAVAAMVVLATQVDGEMLDYGVEVVPVLVPWSAACLAIVVAIAGTSERWAASTPVAALTGALVVATAWSVAMLPFDVLRLIGLVPLPLSGPGLVLRTLLLLAGAAAVVPVLRARRVRQERCTACGRVLPGPLDRLPRWPVVVSIVAALTYPALRAGWLLGGTFGTTGAPTDIDTTLAMGATLTGLGLVAFTLVLFVGRGPSWVRALFGLGGVVIGAALAVVGGLGAIRAATLGATEGLESSPGADLATWTFLLVYGSWFVAGLGVIVGGWRFWARRREDCPACAPLLAP